MNKILFTLLIFIPSIINGQVLQVCCDTTICSSSPVTLTADITGSINLGNLQGVALTDDSYTPAIPIGFQFDFFGNTYSDLLISSNNYVTFDLANAGGYSGWNIAGPIPGNGTNNSIMAPWQDINPGLGGIVEWGSFGTAPNRVFVVRWYQIPMFSCTSDLFCSALYLYEGSNIIETYIENKPLCAAWNGGAAIHGIQNTNGTIAHIITDPTLGAPRNFPLQWTCTNDAWEFVPDAANPNNYIMNQIPFGQILSSSNIVWSDDNGNQVGTGASITVSPTVTTTYTATAVECLSGSSVSGNATVYVSDLTLTPSVTDVLCNGDGNGSITVTPIGTAAPWDFDWQDNNGNTLQTNMNANGPVTLNGLDGGTYDAVVTDDMGCVLTETVVINEPTLITTNLIGANLNCYMSNDGSIAASANGGTSASGNYSYSWTGPNGYTSNNPNVQNLAPGAYTVTISDDNGCTANDSYNVLEPTELIATLNNYLDVTCFGFTDGAINTTVSGGTPNYTLSWAGPNSFSSSLEDLINIAQGIYTLSVLDANNCPATLSVNIGEAGILVNTFVTSNYNNYNVSCRGYSDGIIEVTTTGGTGPYNYSWSGPSTYSSNDEDIIDLAAGTYNLSVTDAQNCTSNETVTLDEPTPLVLILENHRDISCHYENDGFIETSCWGSVPIDSTYKYHWDGPGFFFSNQADIYNLSEAGLYTLTVTDENNCIATVAYDMYKPEELKAIIYNLNDTITDNYPYVNFYDHSLGNPVAWVWSISDGTPNTYAQDHINHHFVAKGDYQVELKVENNSGCLDSTQKTIRVIEEHTLYVPNAFTPDLDGRNDVFRVQHHALREDTYHIAIYDRLGSLVHSSNDPNDEWDGTNDFTGNKLGTGVFTYYVSYQDWDGWKYDHTNCENCTGTITLIR
tara:strand:+ start:174 stop:2894 length:2721 start_codon:yes stop_codon:yes gene_type:complete